MSSNIAGKKAQEVKATDKDEHVKDALNAAEEDIANDPDTQTKDTEADLNEGELAKLDNNNDKADI